MIAAKTMGAGKRRNTEPIPTNRDRGRAHSWMLSKMVASGTKPGRGAVILGDPTDLEDWTYVLQAPFDPWVETRGTQTVLRSLGGFSFECPIDIVSAAPASSTNDREPRTPLAHFSQYRSMS